MAWLIDDIDLSTLAWNISNRSAGWSVPAKRGDNLTIPGRNGTQWVPNKPFDEGNASLNMWAVGANPDGSMPDDGNLRRLCRTNLDKLTAIFGQNSRLLNVVQIEGKAYGAQNMVTNPAFEKADTTVQYTYQNSIPNPAGRKTASAPLLTNLFPNPEMATYATPLWQQRYESIYPDPAHQFGGRGDTSEDLIGTSNYLWPNSFESNTSGAAPNGYFADPAVTLEVVDATSTDKSSQPYGGTRILRATTTATVPESTPIASRPDPFYVGSNHHPVVSFYVRRAAASVTGSFNMHLRMFSYQSDNTTRYNYSDPIVVSVPTSTTAWTLVRFAPTGGTWDTTGAPTDYVGFQVMTDAQWPSGVSVCFDQFSCNLWDTHIANAAYQPTSFWAGKAGPFFNGDSAWGGLTSSSSTEQSLTRWMVNPDDRWIPDAATGTTSPYYTFTDRPSSHSGGSSLNFHAMGWTAGVTQGFSLPLQAPTAGHTYGLRFRGKALAGKSVTVRLQKQGLNETGRTTVASVTFTGAGSGTTAGSRMNGTVNSYEATSYYTAVAGDQLWVRVEMPSSTDGFPIVQFTNLQVNDSFGYFNGDSTDSPNSQYSWSGTAYNSKSIYSQKRVANFSTVGQAAVATSPRSGSTALVNSIQAFCTADGQLTRAVTNPITLPTTQQGFFVGADLWGAYSNEARPTAHGLPQAQLLVELLNSSGLVVGSAQSSTVTLAAETSGVPTHLAAQIAPDSIPSGAATIRVTALMVNPFAGQYLEMLNLLISPIAVDPTDVGAPAFFDGASSGGAWAGTAHQSTSTYSAALPTRWTFGPGLGSPASAAGAGINLISAQTASATPQVVGKAALLSVHAAAAYQVGLSITPQLLDATGAVLGSGDVQVMIQFLDSAGLVQGTGTAGVFNASLAAGGVAQPIQGMVNASGTFSQLVFWFIGSTGAVLTVKINSAYLMPVNTTYNNPVQRLDFNLLYNPQFLVGTTGWNLVNSVAKATSRGNGVSLTSSTSEVGSEVVPVSPGTLTYGGWARKAGTSDVTVAVRTGTVIKNLLINPLPTSSFAPWVGARVTNSYDAANRAMVGTINDATVANGAQRWGSSTTTSPNTHGAPMVTAGLPYSFSCEVATNTGQPMYCWVQWYDASGTYMNLHTDSTPITPGTSFTRLTLQNAVAPTGAVAALVLVGISGTGPRAVGQTISMRRAVFTQTTTAMPYFDGDTATAPMTTLGWDGAAGASTSSALSFTVVASSTVTQTSYLTPVIGKATVPNTATHAQLVFTGSGAEVDSGYLAAPSGVVVDDTGIDPELYPYFDGSSASGGPYGEPVRWAGTADDSVSQVVPAFVAGWGKPTSPTSLVPIQSTRLSVTATSGAAATAPTSGGSGTKLPFTLSATVGGTTSSGGSALGATSGTISNRPPNSVGAWASVPRNITLNSTRTYRLNPATPTGTLGTFVSGQLSLVAADGAVATVSVVQTANPSSVGTVVWTSGALPSTGFNGVISWLDVPVSANSYVYVHVSYVETKHAAGQRVSWDNLLIMPTASKMGGIDYPGYFDGNTIGSAWDGDPNVSTSTYYGGGRRAYAEVREAIDMTSMAGGTRAEFSVSLAIPGAFWEDLIQSHVSLLVSNAQLVSGTQLPLDSLVKTTAPIDDAIITVTPTGTVTGLVMTDIATGATLSLAGNVPAAGVIFDCGAFTAKSGNSSVIKNVSRAGSNGFLPLTPINSETPPTLSFRATGSGTLTVDIQARRRYLIA